LLAAAYFTKISGNEKIGWSVMAAAFGAACIPLILLTWRTTRGREVSPETADVNPLHGLRDALQNRPFRYAVGLWTFGAAAMGVSGYLIVYFMTYILNLDDTWSSLAFLILFACGVLWVPFIDKTSARLGKQWTFTIYVGIWGAIQACIAPFLSPETWWLFFGGMFLASSGLVALFMVGIAMIADVVEVDEFKSGHRREGLYFGTAFFVQKIVAAMVPLVIGIVLKRVGYVPDVPQTETALTGIRALYCWGSGAAFLVSIVFCHLVPITRDRHAALVEAMRLRREGKPYSIEGIEDLLR
jgi:Na+/melibiose symporter-like transporter